jgi:hypothetical protein
MARYLERNIATQEIQCVCIAQEPFDLEGPPHLAPYIQDGTELIAWEGVVSLTPPTSTAKLRWNGTAAVWVEEGDMPTQRARKGDAISQACGEAITAGFPCDTLGDGYFYPSKPNDQANLTGSVLRSMYSTNGPDWSTPFWCADSDGTWEFRLHTAAQIQQVGDCAVVARLRCMGINEQLQAQIIAAETPADLAEIKWPSETP